MHILIYDMGSYIYNDLAQAFQEMGHTCRTIYYHFEDRYNDDFFISRFSSFLSASKYDCVFSVNFFPLISTICYQAQIPYISWCYDSPLDEALQNWFSSNTNLIFLFDRVEVELYRNMGFSNVYHLPLAVNCKRLDTIASTLPRLGNFHSDVSFIGRLYTNSPLSILLLNADPHICGYIEGILQAQLRIYGHFFIDSLISDTLLNTLNESYISLGQNTVKLTRNGLSYAIANQITFLERTFLLDQMGSLYNTHLFSTDSYSFSSPVKCHGPVKYETEMPVIFRNSKLNLCPTLRSIRSGIPLRSLDIMGSHGVLFNNYQPELAESFTDGHDCLFYGSLEEAFDKASFYLQHENLLPEIAENGYQKVRLSFNYSDRLKTIFKTLRLHF